MKDSLKKAINWTEKLLPFESISEKKLRKRFLLVVIRFFLVNIGFPLVAIMVSKKFWMKEYRLY